MYDMRITFPSTDVRFRISSELYQPVFEDWKDNQKDSFFLTEETWNSPLYIVEGSDYLKDLKTETGDMFNCPRSGSYKPSPSGEGKDIMLYYAAL
jgi:hypothetical protein